MKIILKQRSISCSSHFQKMTISSYIECQAAKGQIEYLIFCKRHTSIISTTNIDPRLLISKIIAGKIGRCHISRRHRLIWVYLPTGAVRSHSARAEFNFTVRPPGGASGARQQARSTPPGGGARNWRQIPATSFGHEYRQPVTSDPRFLETHRWLGLACQGADCQFFLLQNAF